MLSKAGTASLILYAVLIGMALINLIIATKCLTNKEIELNKFNRIVDLSKYTIVSIAISTLTLIITGLLYYYILKIADANDGV